MNSDIQTNAWTYRTIIVLGFIFATSTLHTIVLVLRGQPLSELVTALGAIAAAGVIQLLSSPLNRGL